MNAPPPDRPPERTPISAHADVRSDRPVGRWLGCAFPLVLWVFGTLYFGGDLGKWTDDYTTNAIDPATGASYLSLHWTYPRPLGNGLAYAKGTLLWEHDRISHFIGAAAHGLVVVLLWLLLRRIVQARTAAALALAYLVCPMNYEAIFWPSATHSILATASFLLLALAHVRFAREAWGWWSVLLMIGLAYMIPCWWEQPSAGIPALPLLYWATCRPTQSVSKRLLRGLVPVVCCALACWVYMRQVQAAVPPTDRGGSASLITASEFGPRMVEIWAQVRYGLLGQGMTSFVQGAFLHAVGVLTTWSTLLWGAVLAGAAIAWWRAGRLVTPAADPAAIGVSGWRRLSALCFGLAVFGLAWLPVLVIRDHGTAPRMYYYPLIGLVVATAVVLDSAAAFLARRGLKTPIALFEAVLAVAFVAAAGCQVATQAALRQRYLADQSELARLRELVPQPCAQAVFVPVGIQNTPAHTGRLHFDIFATGAFGTAWSSVRLMQQSYQRHDVYGTWLLYGEPLPLSEFNPQTVHYHNPLVGPFAAHATRGCILPLAQLYPFEVNAAGELRLVDELIVERVGEPTTHLVLPHIRALTATQGLAPRQAWLQEPDAAANLATLTGWQRIGTGRTMSFSAPPEWNVPNLATTLRAASGDAKQTVAMKTPLAASTTPLDIFFRVTLKEGDVRENFGGDAMLIVYADDPRQAPLGRLELRRQPCRDEHRWYSLGVAVPPHAEPIDLHVDVEPLSGNGITCGVRITPGHFRKNQ